MRRFELLGLFAGIVAVAAAAVQADQPASLEAAKALAAQQQLPVLVRFGSEF